MKYEIKNRLGLKVVILVDMPDDPVGLAFVTHGQKGSKDQPHIEAFARAFRENGYTAVRFDATHAAGESDGDLFDVTFDTYVNDLEDVIEWARTQPWFISPFALCGHSMGAQSVAWYAQHNPSEVSLLAPMAPVVNFELYSKTFEIAELEEYRVKSYTEVTSSSQTGIVHKIGWGYMESLKKYDILLLAKTLVMPILNVVGSKDKPCPVEHQKIFMNGIASNEAQLIVIDGLEHSYRNAATNKVDAGLDKVEAILKGWISSVS